MDSSLTLATGEEKLNERKRDACQDARAAWGGGHWRGTMRAEDGSQPVLPPLGCIGGRQMGGGGSGEGLGERAWGAIQQETCELTGRVVTQR